MNFGADIVRRWMIIDYRHPRLRLDLDAELVAYLHANDEMQVLSTEMAYDVYEHIDNPED